MENEIINRVVNSALVQLDLEQWYDSKERFQFDLADFLYKGLILRELDYRAALKSFPWEKFKGAHLAIHCSADAIVPTWAFMLAATYAAPFASNIFFGDKKEIDVFLFDRYINQLDLQPYTGQKVIVKGCSKYPVPTSAYLSITARLQPVVQSLMFGEPCSNVPIFKKKKEPSTETPA